MSPKYKHQELSRDCGVPSGLSSILLRSTLSNCVWYCCEYSYKELGHHDS